MNATIFRITENGYITDKMTVKACKTSKQIYGAVITDRDG
jgi:hypothetical protein